MAAIDNHIFSSTKAKLFYTIVVLLCILSFVVVVSRSALTKFDDNSGPELTIKVDKKKVNYGEDVKVTAIVTNNSTAPYEFIFNDTCIVPSYYFDGDMIYEDRMCGMAETEIIFHPHQKEVYELRFSPEKEVDISKTPMTMVKEPGFYTLYATYGRDSTPTSNKIQIEVVE